MTKEEAINILSVYKYANVKSQLMLQKIHTMEQNLYSAQAGLVENEAGVRTSGGNHVSREAKMAILLDLRDRFAEVYNTNETICYNTMVLIQGIYSKNPKIQEAVKSASSECVKLAKYESVLIAYYINDLKIEEIGKKHGYSLRQSKRLLNAARETFYDLYKGNEYSTIEKYVKGLIEPEHQEQEERRVN